MLTPTTVVVVPYDGAWPARFRALATPMREALREAARRIDHVGATAVPGLDAKPVIDIQISVDALEPMDAYRAPLESIGYVWRDDNPDLTKRYFREAPGRARAHVHVRRLGSFAEQFTLLFRDYLRTHGDAARRYAELKHTLAARFADDRASYTEAKAPFIWATMENANRWSQAVGWEPGASDA